MATWTYRHHPGHGSTDHLAAEIIARAARILGLDGAEQAVRQTAGYAPAAVPMRAAVTLRGDGRSVRPAMTRAIRDARDEMPCRTSCCISIEQVSL